MGSIRLSLVCYILGLFAVTLVTGALFVYGTTRTALIEKQHSTEALARAQYRERSQQVEARFQDSLFHRAQTLARLAQFQTDWTRLRFRSLFALGVLSAGHAPNGFVFVPLWVGQSVRGRLSYEMARADLGKIQLDESALFLHLERQAVGPFQIDTFWGSRYRSRSLGDREFPDPTGFAPSEPFAWAFDSFEFDPTRQMCRIRLKVPATSLLPRGTISTIRPESSPMTEAGDEERPSRPCIYIQCATDTHSHTLRLMELRRIRDWKIQLGRQRTDKALASLQRRLTFSSIGIFLASIVGTSLLVRAGLTPLHRLSEAVEAVTPRNFELTLETETLPTELKPIRDRLETTLSLLKRAFEREKHATADISHELRTPLAALLTTTEVGLNKERTPEEYRELLEDCRLTGQQMHSIVERLLALARLDAGADHLDIRPVDLGSLALTCEQVIRPLTLADHLTFRVTTGEGIEIETDADKLKEILLNLLHNSVQYNRPGGSIDLTITRDHENVIISVKDTGIGIEEEAAASVFQRFYRSDASRSGDGLHAGLGLSIVKAYVDLLGGTIGLTSKLGEGTTITLRLPLTQ